MSELPPLAQRSQVLWLAAAAAAVAFIVGGLIAVRPAAGVVALAAMAFLAVAMVDVSLGLALWIPALFVVPGIVTSLMGLVIAGSWLGSLASVRPPLRVVLPGQRLLVGSLAVLLVWLSLSLLWARDPHVGWTDLRGWMIAAAVLTVVASSVTTEERLRLLLAAFVLGAMLSVAIGWLGASSSSRFAGAEGNPNDLAAQLLPVIVLAAALIADRARKAERVVLAGCVAVLTISLAATQSRGGLVAFGATIVAGAVIYNRQRRYVLLTLSSILAVAAVWFAISPGQFARVTRFTSGGAGRTTLWDAALRMASDYAPIGAGLDNFRIVSQDYVRRPGALRYVSQIESPHVVHNTYLELLAETGVPGLCLFLVVVGTALAALRRAVSRFEQMDRPDLARLARAVLLAVVSVLAAQLFQSNGFDIGLWTLLALGPAMLMMAGAEASNRRRLVAIASSPA